MGTIIAIIISITPYIYYLYQGIPDVVVWDSPFGSITSNYYESVQVMGYIVMGKIIPFLLILIWFFTCKHWWYHALLVPLCMFLFQIYSTLNDDIRFADSNEFFILAPIILVMLIFSYTIRMRVFDKVHGIDFGELSRGNWKGEIVTTDEDDDEDHIDEEEEEDGDDEPLFMG